MKHSLRVMFFGMACWAVGRVWEMLDPPWLVTLATGSLIYLAADALVMSARRDFQGLHRPEWRSP